MERDDEAAAEETIGWSIVDDGDTESDRLSLLEAGGGDVWEALSALRQAGIWAQPNHVLFAMCAHSALLGASPLHASALAEDLVYATPLHASARLGAPGCCCHCPPHPATGEQASWKLASKIMASPLHASPLHASGYILTGVRDSTVLPATGAPPGWVDAGDDGDDVAIIDTGLPDVTLRPPALSSHGAGGPADVPDSDPDGILDPVAGHGTFIAGVVVQAAPGAGLRHIGLIEPSGALAEQDLAAALRALADDDPPKVLNLSVAGYAFEEMRQLARAVRLVQLTGTVVVAAAGNDATCRPTYPAALPGVIGVGAVDAEGRPAPFTNYGPWVRACAPGVDVTSYFFVGWDGEWRSTALPQGVTDDRSGWATWSGTSFAAPYVAGVIAQHRISGMNAKAAVAAAFAERDHVPWLGRRILPPEA